MAKAAAGHLSNKERKRANTMKKLKKMADKHGSSGSKQQKKKHITIRKQAAKKLKNIGSDDVVVPIEHAPMVTAKPVAAEEISMPVDVQNTGKDGSVNVLWQLMQWKSSIEKKVDSFEVTLKTCCSRLDDLESRVSTENAEIRSEVATTRNELLPHLKSIESLQIFKAAVEKGLVSKPKTVKAPKKAVSKSKRARDGDNEAEADDGKRSSTKKESGSKKRKSSRTKKVLSSKMEIEIVPELD